jgi:defect-in-organelle-trafficking protein DotA
MRLWWLLFLLLSSQIFAQSAPLSTALSLNPPPSDSSVIFLGNIFGVVDGVLSGTGSQIFGHMMQVFNAAILGLGSIIIMYTLIVGTLNTAQEGEFLGRQWSSVWIPVRCTTGLALLIPKATGYSLIQIFILWVIVQGVGAGDRIWTAALEYLNMGGKIIQAQQSSNDLINKTDTGATTNDVFFGASVILMGQVCMYGLQKIFESAQQYYKEQANEQKGPCSNLGSGNTNWQQFCSGTIPDFVATVDINKAEQQAVAAWEEAKKKDPEAILKNPNAPMPNFETGIFTFLNGFCGTLRWNFMDKEEISNYQSDFSLSSDDTSSLSNSRNIALQTMFSNLASVAYAMVSNNDAFNTTSNTESPAPQFGVALNASGEECKDTTDSCQDWGAMPGQTNTPPVLFAGNEFINAIGSYAGIMMPVLNLKYQHQFSSFYKKAKQFIDETERTGWIFAGAYFFKLVNLSGSPKGQAYSRDTESGLETSSQITTTANFGLYALKTNGNSLDTTAIANILQFLNPDITNLKGGGAFSFQGQITALRDLIWSTDADLDVANTFITGQGYVTGYTLNQPNNENSVLGFIRNSAMMDVGAQPGIRGVKGIKVPKMVSVVKPFKMPRLKKGCYGKIQIKIIKLKICLFNGFVDATWAIISAILNAFAMIVYAILWVITQILIVAPILMVIVPMVNTAFKVINNMSLSPILDLANLGAYFIQSTLYGYLGLFAVSAIAALIPITGVPEIIKLIMSFMMPFYTAWLTYFLGIGFTTLFYVPMIPYIIFIFGAVAWIFLVIEAVLAGPLVALLMTSPEGEGLLGNKGEQGLMLLVNLFLRPSLMIIGFITGIALSYVNIWMLNASYSIAADYIRSPPDTSRDFARGWRDVAKEYKYQDELGKCHQREYNKLQNQGVSGGGLINQNIPGSVGNQNIPGATNLNQASDVLGRESERAKKGWEQGADMNKMAQDICAKKMSEAAGVAAPKEQGVDWDKYPFASLMGMIFYLVLYISLYTTMVQKGFQLIALLPDKVIRWVGGSESAGQETLRWEGEVAGQMSKAGETGTKSITSGLGGLSKEANAMVKGGGGGDDDESGSAKAGPDGGGAPPAGGGGGVAV